MAWFRCTENKSSGSGTINFVPAFNETQLADNSAKNSSFTLTEDYHNYDLLRFKIANSDDSLVDYIYCTPDLIDDTFAIDPPATVFLLNYQATNKYVTYTVSADNLTWSRANKRDMDCTEVVGLTTANCTMTITDLYSGNRSSQISISDSISDYDILILGGSKSTSYDEQGPFSEPVYISRLSLPHSSISYAGAAFSSSDIIYIPINIDDHTITIGLGGCYYVGGIKFSNFSNYVCNQVWCSGDSGSETYTITKAGLYLCICGTSYQGTASLSLPAGVTPMYSGTINDSRPCYYSIANLAVGDVVTMNNSKSSWSGLTKAIFELIGLDVISTPTTDYTNDGTATYTFDNSGTANFNLIISGGIGSTITLTDSSTDKVNISNDIPMGETGKTKANIIISNGGTYSAYGYDGGYGYYLTIPVKIKIPSPVVPLVPEMQNNSQDGYVASASTEFSSSYQAYEVFDRTRATAWAPENVSGPHWVQIELPIPKISLFFIVTTRTGDYFATSVTVQGSNDGTYFTTLGTETNMVEGSSAVIYNFSTTAYKYYRFIIDEYGLQEIYIGGYNITN